MGVAETTCATLLFATSLLPGCVDPTAQLRGYLEGVGLRGSLAPVLMSAAERAGVDWRLALAIIEQESRYKPRAVGRHGEVGLMQVLPKTGALVARAAELSAFVPPKPAPLGSGQRYVRLGTLGQPGPNIRIGLTYLGDQVRRFGDWPTALRAYNRGPAAAKQRRPRDRYAEDVALRYMRLSRRLR